MRRVWYLQKVKASGALGAGQGEAAAGGHKLVHLLQRETLSILHGDSHSPAVCALSRLSSFQDHLVLEIATVPDFRRRGE